MKFSEIPKFKKEFKKYRKKYKSLNKDIENFKDVLLIFPCGNKSANWNFLKGNEKASIYKTRLSCAYLKRNSLRIIYAYHEEENLIVFIEIFFKGDKGREDEGRIQEYLRGFKII